MYPRLVPIFFALYRTAFIAETCSLILAICELNIEVLRELTLSHSLVLLLYPAVTSCCITI